MEIEFGQSKMGKNRHKVFPVLVPAVIMLSSPFRVARGAWSWEACGTIVKRVTKETTRHARRESVRLFQRVDRKLLIEH